MTSLRVIWYAFQEDKEEGILQRGADLFKCMNKLKLHLEPTPFIRTVNYPKRSSCPVSVQVYLNSSSGVAELQFRCT